MQEKWNGAQGFVRSSKLGYCEIEILLLFTVQSALIYMRCTVFRRCMNKNSAENIKEAELFHFFNDQYKIYILARDTSHVFTIFKGHLRRPTRKLDKYLANYTAFQFDAYLKYSLLYHFIAYVARY